MDLADRIAALQRKKASCVSPIYELSMANNIPPEYYASFPELKTLPELVESCPLQPLSGEPNQWLQLRIAQQPKTE